MSNQLDIDRISDLPDPIICHILSFLPTKHAVGTSVLSKRWKYLWASVPTLDFDDWLLFNPQTDHGNIEPFGEISFMNFVDRVLIFRDVLCLEKLGLTCRGAYDTYRINSWIRVAVRRGVEELDLGLYLPCPIVFPRSLFTSKTLVKFNLRCFTVLDVPQTVCFSSLKILYLHLVEFVDMDSTKRLFDGCPVLEELVLQNCRREKVAFFYICSPTLKRLTVDLSLFGTEDSKKHTVVNAPVLDCLTINNFTSDYLSTNLYSLIRGSIPLREIFPTSLEVGPGFVHRICRLLQSTSYIKFLSLSSNLLKLLNSGAYTSLPTFYNLNQMELSADAINWNLLLALLLRVPNLQVLVFNKGFVDLENHEEPFLWSPDYYVPHCLMFHLKEIKVGKFGGTKEELFMVNYFLEEARVLSEMTINSGGSFKHKAKICKKLKKIKQGSPTCKVNVIL